MVTFKGMKIDTPYPILDIEDRGADKDPLTSECTYCRRTEWGVKHSTADIVVVRRWREHSVWAPEADGIDSGGWYEWRCLDHPFRGNSSPYAENAPEHLRPERRERCEHMSLGTRCQTTTGERYEARWLCSEHAASVVARLRIEERMNEIEAELHPDSDITPEVG